MQVDLLIIHAKQLITCANNSQAKRGQQMREVGMIEDGAVAVHNGKIVAVGATSDIQTQYQSSQTIDATHKVVCPGFVDCHTHTVYAGNRLDEFEKRIAGKTYMEILAEGGGILSTMQATREATQDLLLKQANSRLDSMMRLGTTTVEIKTGYGLDTATEVKMLKVIDELAKQHPMTIVPTFLGAHAVPPEFDSTESYTEYILNDMLPAIHDTYLNSDFKERGIPLFVDVFCEDGVFDVELSRKILQIANQDYGMFIKAHVDEFVNLGGVTASIELGAVSVDHLDVTPDEELKKLAQSDTVGVFLPAVNFNLGSDHYGDARKLLDAGGIVALSTDLNPGSAPTPSLPMVMSIACRYQKMLPAEALNAITINAAVAIQAEDRVGSIEVGKQADFVVCDTLDYRAIAYEFGNPMIETVIIKGGVVWTQLS